MPMTTPATASTVIVRNTYDFIVNIFRVAALLVCARRRIPACCIRKFPVMRTSNVRLLKIGWIFGQRGDDEHGPVAVIVAIEKLREHRIGAVGNAILLEVSRTSARRDDFQL